MSSVNKVILIGYVGKDPEVRTTTNGKSVAGFSLATSEKWGGEERTEWHSIVAWEKLAEIAGNYIHKGQQVYVEGKLTTRSWEDGGVKKYKTEIVANIIRFLGAEDKKAAPVAERSQPAAQPAAPMQHGVPLSGPNPDNLDDLPF